eukprot:SAG31_NODE_2317_length_5947_cov_2.753591_6_plen_283_part_00
MFRLLHIWMDERVESDVADGATGNPLDFGNTRSVDEHALPRLVGGTDARQGDVSVAADEFDGAAMVLSVLTPEQRWLGRVLTSTADGESPSALCRAVQSAPVYMVLVLIFDYTPKGDAVFVAKHWDHFSPGAQALISLSMAGLCAGLLCMMLLASALQRATRPNGELEQLGAGKVLIAAADAKRLRWWRRAFYVPAVPINLLGIVATIVLFPWFSYQQLTLDVDCEAYDFEECLANRPPQGRCLAAQLADGTGVCFTTPVTGPYVLGMGVADIRDAHDRPLD